MGTVSINSKISKAGSGASVAATLTGSGIVGEKITATLPPGVVGTLQFTKTLKVSPFTKSDIAGAVANYVNSLQYTVLPADVPYSIGCGSSNIVSASNIIAAIAAPTGSDPAPGAATAMNFSLQRATNGKAIFA